MRFPHGGMEIGGLLIGSRRDDVVRIVGIRPIAIEYGRGASFMLTDADHEALQQLVAKTHNDLRPHGRQVMGWYESHTRRDLALTPADLETYDRHFSDPLQVCIVVKPERENTAATAVYIRDAQRQLLQASFVADIASEDWAPVTVEESASTNAAPDAGTPIAITASQESDSMPESLPEGSVIRPEPPVASGGAAGSAEEIERAPFELTYAHADGRPAHKRLRALYWIAAAALTIGAAIFLLRRPAPPDASKNAGSAQQAASPSPTEAPGGGASGNPPATAAADQSGVSSTTPQPAQKVSSQKKRARRARARRARARTTSSPATGRAESEITGTKQPEPR